LKGYEYKLSGTGKHAGVYTETTKEIGNYVGRLYGDKMRKLVTKGIESTPEEPDYPEGASGKEPSEKDKAVWNKRYDMYLRLEKEHMEQKSKVFTIIWSLCEKTVQN